MTDKLEAVRDFLRRATYRREHVDTYLDPDAKIWARFDPDLGYTLRTFFDRDGVDGYWTLQTYEPGGHRRIVNLRGQPCRINTYGDSFTQGAQVSDGETWQEVLAAHFCEPIRNWGIGGQGVYHAWLRMKRVEEAGEFAAPNVILNMWGDDHQRSINAWRWLTYANTWDQASAVKIFHGNPWRHLRLDADGNLLEMPNRFDTPESLYDLCDTDNVIDAFLDDPVVRIIVAMERPASLDYEPIRAMGDCIGMGGLDFGDPDAAQRSAWRIYNRYAVETTIQLMRTRVLPWCAENGRNLMVLLSYPSNNVYDYCAGKDRDADGFDDWNPLPLREALAEMGVPTIDTLPLHGADFAAMKTDPQSYIERYFIGHYNPSGNQFFARAIKDGVRDWLDPKPPAYAGGIEQLVRFEGYLPGTQG